MSQWAMLLRIARCTGCGACVLACRAWNHGKRGDAEVHPRFVAFREPANLASDTDTRGTMRENWRSLIRREMGTDPAHFQLMNISYSCMHCEMPSCAAACPVHRIEKEEKFGAVLVKQEVTCLSCGLCLRACPWGIPSFWKPYGHRSGEKGPSAAMTKCDFCHDRLICGQKPACAAACPTRALYVGEETDLLRRFPEATRPDEILGGVERNGPHFWIWDEREQRERV